MSELQSALAGSVGHRLYATVVLVPRAVEHYLSNPRLLWPLGEKLPHLCRALRLRALELSIRDRQERAPLYVVHQLRGHVLERAVHDQSRTCRGTRHLPTNPNVAAHTLLRPAHHPPNLGRHYLPPALPALRRICSPAYLIPFPLYGSGGLRPRISAATCPTASLSAPSMTTCVGVGALSLTPSGARYSIGWE